MSVNRNRLYLIPIAVFAFSTAAVFATEPIEMRVAAAHFPLMTQVEKYQDLGYGYLSDVLMAAAQANNLNLEIKYYPLQRAVYEFFQDNIHFSIGGPDNVPSIEGVEIAPADIGFIPIIELQFLLYYYKPDHPQGIAFTKFDDLREYSVNVRRGSPSDQLYQGRVAAISKYNELRSAFEMLKRGRVDLVEAPFVVARQTFLQDFPEEYENFVPLDKPAMSADAGLVYKLSNSEASKIAESFNKGLLAIENSGELYEILHRYFGENLPRILIEPRSSSNP